MSETQGSPYTYRQSYSPTDRQPYHRSPIHHGHPVQHASHAPPPPPPPQPAPYPSTNGHTSNGPPPIANNFGTPYYDPVSERPSERPPINGQWGGPSPGGYSSYAPPPPPPSRVPPLNTQPIPHQGYNVVRDNSVGPLSAHSQVSQHSFDPHHSPIRATRVAEPEQLREPKSATTPTGNLNFSSSNPWGSNNVERTPQPEPPRNRMNISSLLSNPTEEAAPPAPAPAPVPAPAPAPVPASVPAPPLPAPTSAAPPTVPSTPVRQASPSRVAEIAAKMQPTMKVDRQPPMQHVNGTASKAAAKSTSTPKAAPAKPRVTPAKKQPAQETTPSANASFASTAASESFNNKFKDFKYHESMSIDETEVEKEDAEVDENIFHNALEAYKLRVRKRKLDASEDRIRGSKRRVQIFAMNMQVQLTAASRDSLERAREMILPEAAAIIKKQEEDYGKERKKTLQQTRRKEKQDEARRIKAEQQAKREAELAEKRKKEEEERQKYLLEVGSLDGDGESIVDGHDSDNSAAVTYDGDGAKMKKRRIVINKKNKAAKEAPAPPEKVEPHASKGYNQLFEQIWRDIARKEIPRCYRTYQASHNIKQSNLRKTVQLASKEARRWQMRTNRSQKETQARAKRTMREMITFWKRNEKEERDNRRRAEKEAVERAKKEEEEREARRQARKLNFLISQTELYSHFIGRKIKTQELERSTDTGTETAPGETAAEKVPDALAAGVTPSAGPTKFDELDFDNEDETALQQAALHNAQTAVREAKERADAFNKAANLDMDDEGEMNFQNPTGMGDVEIEQPKLLSCQLKEYQLKGLNWLANLYEQGINGILADEMGLGKTVQSISVMAYLAEKYNIWGPFLVIAPASTLHNWQQEITKFVPRFKALPYWGNQKDRKTLRKFWDRKSPTYTEDSQFHVLITSYQIVVGDAQYFQKMRWQYMILDEAQAIKSSSSSRWKTLLGMQCRNRLLLTGTPIQNSMQELWALLHFIMPGLFDSHDEFSEWFSKDIESHTQSNTQLNEQQLQRLHMILKPFMLRRVKRHVQKELGEKLELDIYCDLTYRQRKIYKQLRDKLSDEDLIDKASSGNEGTASLMNLVMQFRKVCNHPDLFERAEVHSPFSFATFADTVSFMREGTEVNLNYTAYNRISYPVPRLVFREERLDVPGRKTRAGFNTKYLDNLLNIWTPDYLYERSREENSAFGWLRFVDSSPKEASRAYKDSLAMRMESLAGAKEYSRIREVYDEDQPFVPKSCMLLVSELSRRDNTDSAKDGVMADLFNVQASVHQKFKQMERDAPPSAVAPPISVVCDDPGVVVEQDNILFNPAFRRIMNGPTDLDEARLLEDKVELSAYPNKRLTPEPFIGKGQSHIQVPSMRRFVSDSGKLAALDKLLMELKAGGHRVLLYFQMTRMMDMAEEYLTYRKYRYLRLDGSSKVEDRRDMVADFQNKPEIFLFMLSTRAGGLGLNLTAADCVIFYDSDWNPTVDQQAEDRAHRLGQTRQVRVYRLLTRGTIEERIRMRAKQKQDVQKVVMTGKAAEKKGVDFAKGGGNRDVAAWLFEGDEEAFEAELARREKQKEEERAAKSKGKKGKKGAAPAVNGSAAAPDLEKMLDSMYHEGEGNFASEVATPASFEDQGGVKMKATPKKRSNKKKTTKERLNMIDGL